MRNYLLVILFALSSAQPVLALEKDCINHIMVAVSLARLDGVSQGMLRMGEVFSQKDTHLNEFLEREARGSNLSYSRFMQSFEQDLKNICQPK